MQPTILISGTGAFAARVLLDTVTTARKPLTVVVAGRNRERLSWLVTAAKARAVIFNQPVDVVAREIDLLEDGAAEAAIESVRPSLVVQAASVQSSSVIAATDNGWSQLVAEGGLSATAVFQALLSIRVAAAMTRIGIDVPFINCCFPDVVNGMIKALGHRVFCGIGNISILASVFAADRGLRDPTRLKVLAHYQTIAAWRCASHLRCGQAPRVFLDDVEIVDVFDAFHAVKLTTEPVIEISGASGVPLILAVVEGRSWLGHVPGPDGLPGGYPVKLENGVLALDLPGGVSQPEAMAWNARFEETSGLVVGQDGRARYTGHLRRRLAERKPHLAEGFELIDIENTYREMHALRRSLQTPA